MEQKPAAPAREWAALSGLTKLSDLKKTEFAPTLESAVLDSVNTIYAPTLLYAWDEIRTALPSPVVVNDGNSSAFRLLNQSISYRKALAEGEYSVTTTLTDSTITAKAFFNKKLSFANKLQALDFPIVFQSRNVSGMGMFYYDEKAAKTAQILYYKDDSNFVLKLWARDHEHEIIFATGLGDYGALSDGIRLANELIARGEMERDSFEIEWKYEVFAGDVFAIPVFRFNIETNFNNLEGQRFLTKDNKRYEIGNASQRTGLELDENGGSVESKAEIVVEELSERSYPPVPHPKAMLLNKPFLVIMKHVDQPNPYFVMRVQNPELMVGR